MLRLPFKYFLNRVDEMARPALEVPDEKGKIKQYEPIANVPYFMGQSDIDYLYQFPPSLWAEAFHYRINTAFREFVENLEINEKNKLEGKPLEKWNDVRDVKLQWADTGRISKEMREKGAAVKVISYKFNNVKMFVEHYWDTLQRDIDTEFFAKNDDTPEARKEYENILANAMRDNADAGGFIGTSLRKYTGILATQQKQKLKIKGKVQDRDVESSIWSCIGYNPVTLKIVSGQIGNWLKASHMGWGVSDVDPAHKKITVPNKGKNHFRSSAITNVHKLSAVARKITSAGGTPFNVDKFSKNGYVHWPHAEKWVEYRTKEVDGKSEPVGSPIQIPIERQDSKSGIRGIDVPGQLPFLEPGYRVDSKAVNTVKTLSDFTNFSEIGDEKTNREMVNQLISAEPHEFETLSKEILDGNPQAKERLDQQIGNIIHIRDILSFINDDRMYKNKLTEIDEKRKTTKDKKEKKDLDEKYDLLTTLGNFKTWVNQKRSSVSDSLENYKARYEKLLEEFKETQNSHYEHENKSHWDTENKKPKLPSQEEKSVIEKNSTDRKPLLKALEKAFSDYEYARFTQGNGRIVANNFEQLLAVYLRDVQSKAKKYDVFSYAISTHNMQRQSRNPLGLDMDNPLAMGERKYPGLSDKTKGIGMFVPNKSSKHRLNATKEQWAEIKKYFGKSDDINDFPFNVKEIDQLKEAGEKYLKKVYNYLSQQNDLLEYLGINSSEIANLDSAYKIKKAVRKAKETHSNVTPPAKLRVVMDEIGDTSDKISMLNKISSSGTIDSAVQEGVNYAIKVKGGDPVSEAAKYDPTFPASLEFSKEYIAKAAETYLMRSSGSGPLLYWLNIVNDPHVDPFKKLKVYFEARDEVKEIVKNYVYTLCQLPQQNSGTALEVSRRKRAGYAANQAKATSSLGSGEEQGSFDAQVKDRFDSDKVNPQEFLNGEMVKIIKSSIFDNSDPTQEVRNACRRFRQESGTLGIGIGHEKIGHDIETFTEFLVEKIKAAQENKKNSIEKLEDMDMDQTEDNEVLSNINFASLLYGLMQLEVEDQYGAELDKNFANNAKDRDAQKKILVNKAMQDWKIKNGKVSSPSAKTQDPDLDDKNVVSMLQHSVNGVVKDMKLFADEDEPRIPTVKIPPEIRSPVITNALEVLTAVLSELPKNEKGNFDYGDLDKEIDNLDSSPDSPWKGDSNRQYKINVVLLGLGDEMKYKQAARTVTPSDDDLQGTEQQIAQIKRRMEELKKKKQHSFTSPIKSAPPESPLAKPMDIKPPEVQQPIAVPLAPQVPKEIPKASVRSNNMLQKRKAAYIPPDEDL